MNTSYDTHQRKTLPLWLGMQLFLSNRGSSMHPGVFISNSSIPSTRQTTTNPLIIELPNRNPQQMTPSDTTSIFES